MDLGALELSLTEPLSEGAVHIWLAKTDCLGAWLAPDSHAKILSAGEVERFSRFISVNSGREYLLGRLMLRLILSRYFPKVSPAAWEFGFNRYGKPFVKNLRALTKLEFNLSHSGGTVVLALTTGADIGVDIETPRERVDHLNLAKSVFSNSELVYLETLKHKDVARRFFQFWTLKEAYIKARGVGLALSLKQFSICLSEDIEEERNVSITFASEFDDEPLNWWLSIYKFRENSIALAVKRKGYPERVLTFDFNFEKVLRP